MKPMYPAQPFSPTATLTADINATNTRLFIDKVENMPAPPNYVSFTAPNDEIGETVQITAIGATFIDVIRGVEGIAQPWNTGAIIRRTIDAKDVNDMQDNIRELYSSTKTIQDNYVTGATIGGAMVTKINNQVVLPAYPATLPANDVYPWAKQATKPVYTKAEIGLDNIDNTSDIDKPISTLQQNALAGKVPITRKINNKTLSADINLNATDIGLGNVNNTSDSNKPISILQQNALNTLSSQINTLQPIVITGTISASQWVASGDDYMATITDTRLKSSMNMTLGLADLDSIQTYSDMSVYRGQTNNGSFTLLAINPPEIGTSITFFAEARVVQ